MDEHTVRARAGLLNLTSWLALLNILLWKVMTFLPVLFLLVPSSFFLLILLEIDLMLTTRNVM